MQTGLTAVTLYGTAGGEPGDAIANVQDMSDEITCGVADVSSRDSGGWKLKGYTLLEATAEISVVWDGTDTSMKALRDACRNNTLIAIGVLDESNGYGWWADCVVTGFSVNMPLVDGMTVPISFKSAGAVTPMVPA